MVSWYHTRTVPDARPLEKLRLRIYIGVKIYNSQSKTLHFARGLVRHKPSLGHGQQDLTLLSHVYTGS